MNISEDDINKIIDSFTRGKMFKLKETTTTVNLTGGTVEEQVWNYFRSIGFSEEATAGIMGNFYQESGTDPTVDGGAAAGICMFEKSTGCFSEYVAYANSKGKEWTDLQSQLEYLMKQLPSTFNTYTGLQPYYYNTGETLTKIQRLLDNRLSNYQDKEIITLKYKVIRANKHANPCAINVAHATPATPK